MTSTRCQTALRFISAFETLSVETFRSLLTPNYIKEVLESFPVRAEAISEDQQRNQVIISATSETRFRDDAKDAGIPDDEWAYKGEYVFIFSMDESGEKIERVLEFVDSKKTVDTLRPLMLRARGNKAKAEGKVDAKQNAW